MKYVRPTKRRGQNYRDAHTRIICLWRDGARKHQPHFEIFEICQSVIGNADVTNADRARLHQALWTMREHSVLTHAKWQLYLDGKPIGSGEYTADDYKRLCGRHEYVGSNDPYYADEPPHQLYSEPHKVS